jgi:O-antigen ligase
LKTLLSKLAEILEKGFVVLTLQLAAKVSIPFLSGGGGGTKNYAEGSIVNQAIWLGIYLITFCLVAVRWKRFIRVVTADKLLLLLLAIAVLSIVWSVEPKITLRREIGLLGSTLFAMYLATRYSPSELLRLLGWTLGIAALLSLVCGMVLPSYGIMGGKFWRGIYVHKNAMGRMMAMCAIVLLLLTFSNRKYRWLTGLGIGLSIGLLLLSQSKGALVVFISLLALLPLYNALRLNYTIAVPLSIVVIIVSAIGLTWLVSESETVLGAFGKDATLTGRTDIWAAAVDMINQRPLLGYGYGAFWLGLESEYSAYVWNYAGWEVPNAHNGFIDLTLNLGYLGISVFLIGFLMNYLQAVRWALLTKTLEGVWPLEYMTLILIASQSESVTLTYKDIFWILYVTITLSTRTYLSQASKTVRLSANLS